MEELLEALRQAQCAVLNAQRDLIALRWARDNQHGGPAARPAEGANSTAVSLQSAVQAKQEEAVRHLERGAHLFCCLLKEKCDSDGESASAAQQRNMDAAKRAMRRYFEAQLDAQRRREEQFQQQLAATDHRLAAAHNNTVLFAQRTSARRLASRVLSHWLQRTLHVRANRERVEGGRQLNKTRVAVAGCYAYAKAGRQLRLRCFYRWKVKQLHLALAARHAREKELEEQLQRTTREVHSAEAKLQQQQQLVEIEKLRDTRKRNTNIRLEKELEEEVVRLKRVMDEMAYEFSERTSTYVRQQEEMCLHYAERERCIMHDVITAEELSYKHQRRAEQLITVMTEQRESFVTLMNATCTAVGDCVRLKVSALHDAAMAIVRESCCFIANLTAKTASLEDDVLLLSPLSERVLVLEQRCEEAQRQIERGESTLRQQQQKQWVSVRRCEVTAVELLRRMNLVACTWRHWALWQQYTVKRRASRELYAVCDKLHALQQQHEQLRVEWQDCISRERTKSEAMLRATIESAKRSAQQEHDERRDRVLQHLLLEENKCRCYITELGMNGWKCLRSEAAREEAELLYAELRAEHSVEMFHATEAQAEAQRQLQQQLDEMYIAQTDRLFALERAGRLLLQQDALYVRYSLRHQYDTSCMVVHRRALQRTRDASTVELQALGRLVVEYCAREAFTHWRLYTERRRIHRGERRMAAVAVWLDTVFGYMTVKMDAKLDALCYYLHQLFGSCAADLAQRSLLLEKLGTENDKSKEALAVLGVNVRRSLQLYNVVLVVFMETAADWCAGREELLLESCPDAFSHALGRIDAPACVPGSASPGPCGDNSVFLFPLERAMRLFLVAERSTVTEHMLAVGGVIQSTTATLLEQQQQQHAVGLDELLRYQTFLEGRIAAAGVIDDADLHWSREARIQIHQQHQQVTEMRERIVSLIESKHYEKMCHEKEKQRLEGELHALQYHVETERQEHEEKLNILRTLQRSDALVDAVRQYERVLVAFEEEVTCRRGLFSAVSYMFGEVDRFSNALLRRSEADLQELTRLQIVAVDTKMSELQAVHESVLARLMQTVYASQEQSETMCRWLLQQLECGAREVCEARARLQEHEWQKSAMHRRMESLLDTLQRDNVRHMEEKKRLEDELLALRRLSQEQQQQRELAAEDARRCVVDAQWELRRVECELLAAERRHALERAALHASLEEGRKVHTITTTTRTETAIPDGEDTTWERHGAHTPEFELLLKQMAQFVEDLFSAACDTVEAKIIGLPMEPLLLGSGSELKPGEAVRDACSTPPSAFSREMERGQRQEREEMHERIRSLVETLRREKMKHEEEKSHLETELCALRHRLQDGLEWQQRRHRQDRQQEKQKQKQQPPQQRGDSHDFRRDESPADMKTPRGGVCLTPPRHAVPTGDLTQSMVRFSKMLHAQRCKNDTRLQQLDTLVTEVDDLIERGLIVTRLERSSSL